MFLLLNNEIIHGKPILQFPFCLKKNSSDDPLQVNFNKYNRYSEISATGISSSPVIKRGDITLILYGNIKNISSISNNVYIKRRIYENIDELYDNHSDDETSPSGGSTEPQRSVVETRFAGGSLLPYENNNIQTDEDVLIELYLNYGFEYMVQLLEGNFVIFLFDNNLNHDDSKLYIAQDRLGLCPLYVLTEETAADRKILGFSTLAQNLETDKSIYQIKYTVKPFVPGTYSYYTFPYRVLSYWKIKDQNIRYNNGWPKNRLINSSIFLNKTEYMKCIDLVKNEMKESIKNDIEECLIRSHNYSTGCGLRRFSGRKKMNYLPESKTCTPIACLLSGGVDSSLITAIVKDYMKSKNYDTNQLHTFAMGFHDSADLGYAKSASEYLETNHTEMILSETEYMRVIPETIQILETSDIATIRYGAALYLMLKHIHDKTDIRDIFTGDGADEVMGGYLNFFYMNNYIEHDHECNRLLSQYHMKGALYQKIFDHFGMRWYRPFLNDSFLNAYMSIPMEFRYSIQDMEPNISPFDFGKEIMRTAFSIKNYSNHRFTELLPKQILWRSSEPGYDSISSYHKPTRQIIAWHLSQEYRMPEDGTSVGRLDDAGRTVVRHASENISQKQLQKGDGLPIEPELEIGYYQELYKKYFPHMENIFPLNVPPYKYAKSIAEPTFRDFEMYLDFHLEYQDRSL